jgi:hypothetical protein
MNNSITRKYRTYLLRLWNTETTASGWRASLEDPRTGERIGFACMEQLFAFLMEQVEGDMNKLSNEKGGKYADLSKTK